MRQGRQLDIVGYAHDACWHRGLEMQRAKVSVRTARRETLEKLKKGLKDGLSEDTEKDAEADLQKVHDTYIKKIEDTLIAKNKEIMTV